MKEEIARKIDELVVINIGERKGIDSREVAEMIGKSHSHLMRDIRGYIEVILTSPNLDSLDFFIESKYEDTKGETRPCYLITKQGCEMVANKLTGEKGILFTAEYVQAFNKMDEQINKVKQLSPMKMLELQFKALKEQEDKIKEVDQDLQNFKVDIPLFGSEQYDLQKMVRAKGTNILGGRKAAAYKDKSLRQRLYADLQGEIKRQFDVTTYKAIKRSQLEIAKEIVDNYKPPYALAEEIKQVNKS